jgi:hypothetical protein
MIDFGNGQHKVIIGMTGTGKTYTAFNTLKPVRQGVFFFNTMHVPTLRGYTRAKGNADLDDIMDLIEGGGKVNFLPSTDLKNAGKQLIAIINGLYARRWEAFIFVIDEVHLYRQESLQAILRAITTGRNQGVEMVSVSQRLALVDNTIMSQSPEKVIFFLENETKYCENYGIPYSEIEQRIKGADPGGINPKTGKYEPSHAYCTYFMGRVEGAFIYGVN